MSQYDPMFDLKIIVGCCDLYFSDFALYLENFCCMNFILQIMSQYDPTFDLKINVGHCDLYFMDQ